LSKEDEISQYKNRICELNLRTEDKLNQTSRIETMKNDSFKRHELIQTEHAKVMGVKEQTNLELKSRLAKVEDDLSRTKFKLVDVNKQNVLLNNSIECDKSKSAITSAIIDQDNINLNTKIVDLNKHQDHVQTIIKNVECDIKTISDKINQQKLETEMTRNNLEKEINQIKSKNELIIKQVDDFNYLINLSEHKLESLNSVFNFESLNSENHFKNILEDIQQLEFELKECKKS